MSSVTASDTGRGVFRTRRPASGRGPAAAPVELEVAAAYNELGRLPETLRQSVAYLDRQSWHSRIVV